MCQRQENNYASSSLIAESPVFKFPQNNFRRSPQKVSVFVAGGVVLDDLFFSPYDEAGGYPIVTMEEYIEEVSTLTKLYKFDDEYELLKPIKFDSVVIEDGVFYISSSEVRIYGSGRTVERAKENSVSMLVNLFESFNSDEYPLSESAKKFRGFLNGFIRRRLEG